jgi:hypothetical protein
MMNGTAHTQLHFFSPHIILLPSAYPRVTLQQYNRDPQQSHTHTLDLIMHFFHARFHRPMGQECTAIEWVAEGGANQVFL